MVKLVREPRDGETNRRDETERTSFRTVDETTVN